MVLHGFASRTLETHFSIKKLYICIKRTGTRQIKKSGMRIRKNDLTQTHAMKTQISAALNTMNPCQPFKNCRMEIHNSKHENYLHPENLS